MFKTKNVLVGAIALALLATTGIQSSTAAPKNQARAVVQADWLEQNVDNPKVRIMK